MIGNIEKIEGNPGTKQLFVIRMGNEGALYPVHPDDVYLRGLDRGQINEGQQVVFITNKETGIAEILQPEKVIGCIRNNNQSSS